ncbi:MAG: tetratricopeptide repeat protein [Magnetococcales bacterium]|nr:tetratricopeptide repeat protein [Magnetococcales bacterium]
MAGVEVESIFEEVDAQLEAENVAKMWHRNRYWIIGGLISLFVGLFAYVGWKEYQAKRDLEVSERYLAAMDLLETASEGATRPSLTDVTAGYGDHGYALMARFLEARTLAGEGKKDAALALLDEVVAKARVPLKELAMLQVARLRAEEPDQALAQLERIPRDSMFKPQALEFAGVLTSAKGDEKGALTFYKDALSLNPEGGLRKRLERRIQRMEG